MKIILCIFLLNITAVSVFGQSVELNYIVGQSVKFPAAVEKGGFLMYGGDPIGESSLGTPGIGKYSGRVQWDKCTGLFSLSGLKMEDIGEYKVQNTDKNITVFQLNVYKDNVNVSKPHVSITQNEYPCTIECTAERGTEATLSWYREGETKPYSRSSVRSAPHLDLPQTVERSGTYTCEAKNSVSNEKASITVGDHCTAPSGSSTIVVSVIATVALLIVFGVLYYCVKREIRGFKRRPEDITRELRANRSKHSTKDGEAMLEFPPGGKTNKVLSPDDVRTLIDVTKLLIDFFLHASGKTSLDLSPDVNKLFDDFDLHTDGKTSLDLSPDVVSTLMNVKKLFDDFHLRTDARRKLIQVDKLLNDSLPAYDKKFLNEDLPAYDEEEQ